MNKNNIETVIGTIVVVFCILLVAVIYNKGFLKHNDSNYVLNAAFERIDGINIGDDVVISGVKIGEVTSKSIDVSNYNALIQMSIQNSIHLPIDTSAEIVSASLLGNKYISLVPGAETEFLKNGDTIEFTQSSISIEGLITKFVFGLDNTKDSTDNTNIR